MKKLDKLQTKVFSALIGVVVAGITFFAMDPIPLMPLTGNEYADIIQQNVFNTHNPLIGFLILMGVSYIAYALLTLFGLTDAEKRY